MLTEDNKRLMAYHYTNVWNGGDLNKSKAVVDETVAANYKDYNPVPGSAEGTEGLKQVVEMFHTGFPDLQTEVQYLVAEEDKVLGFWTARGTHTGPLAFPPVPPTGKKIEITGFDLVRISNGKIVEWWHQEDIVALMQQLGVIPAPAQAGV